MDACNAKVDVFKIPFWPFLGGEQGEYFYSLFYEHPVLCVGVQWYSFLGS